MATLDIYDASISSGRCEKIGTQADKMPVLWTFLSPAGPQFDIIPTVATEALVRHGTLESVAERLFDRSLGPFARPTIETLAAAGQPVCGTIVLRRRRGRGALQCLHWRTAAVSSFMRVAARPEFVSGMR